MPQDVGIQKVWYSDTDPVMEMVAKYVDGEAVLGVDKDIKARFLLPLMEMKAAKGFVNTSLAVDNTRGIKDAEEQEKMRVASDLNDQAMAVFKTLIRQGVTEKEVADQMLKIYQDLGADGFSFEPLVAFGPNAADPHHGPDNTVLKEGDVILFDVGCIKDGYCSDMTRTVVLGKADAEMKKLYNTVLRAQLAALEAAHEGVGCKALDTIARDIIHGEGYVGCFGHSLGHGVGMYIHENPRLSQAAKEDSVLKPGHVVTFEPGIYIEGKYGCRIEDMVAILPDGRVHNFTHSDKQLIEIV